MLPGCSAAGQSGLPVNAPTRGMALPTGTAGPVVAMTTTQASVPRAEVAFADGMLSISAKNSSLNQILREVGRLTGMKITGGVAEDRVFGTYGPAPASEVLTSLLDGTASNILIVDNADEGPAELILTPRHGGPSPPNPNAAAGFADYAPPPPPIQQQAPPPFRGRGPQSIVTGPPGQGGLPPSNGGQTGAPINGGADLGSTPGAFTPAGQSPPDATAQPGQQQPGTPVAVPDADSGQPQSPNGVSTPQQIYEQLMKMRQQQQPPPNPQ